TLDSPLVLTPKLFGSFLFVHGDGVEVNIDSDRQNNPDMARFPLLYEPRQQSTRDKRGIGKKIQITVRSCLSAGSQVIL
ncbi:MAG: hypothetical protein HC820_05175, partial [Hydrococcus sp. RM1_1_31]|nr:hypothetical protein [Hydrococcus sp. RM1_1_31]